MEVKEQIIADIRKKVLIGLNKTYQKLLETKRKNNSVIVVYKDGRIMKIKPNKKEEHIP